MFWIISKAEGSISFPYGCECIMKLFCNINSPFYFCSRIIGAYTINL